MLGYLQCSVEPYFVLMGLAGHEAPHLLGFNSVLTSVKRKQEEFSSTRCSNNQMSGKREKCIGVKVNHIGRNKRQLKGSCREAQDWVSKSKRKHLVWKLVSTGYLSLAFNASDWIKVGIFLTSWALPMAIPPFLQQDKNSSPHAFCPLTLLKVLNFPPGQSGGPRMGCRAPSRWQHFLSSVGCRFLSFLSAWLLHHAEFLL